MKTLIYSVLVVNNVTFMKMLRLYSGLAQLGYQAIRDEIAIPRVIFSVIL